MKRIICKDMQHWRQMRSPGIGGSDAGAIIGMSKWSSIDDVFNVKTGLKKSPDISNNDAVIYGNKAETLLRELFKLDFPEFEVYHNNLEILIDDEYDFLRASVDGEILKSPHGLGVLEIKTSTPRDNEAWAEWENRIPDSYYCQVLHYLMITKYEFAIVDAHLIHKSYSDSFLPWAETRRYMFTRNELADEIAYLREEEIRFWQDHVIPRKRPNSKVVNL